MKYLILFALILFHQMALSQQIEVQQLNRDFDISKIQGKGIVKKSVDDIGGVRLVPPDERDAILKKSSVYDQVKGWDSYSKDSLLLHAQMNSITELVSKYPKIPKSKLMSIISLLKKAKK